MPDSNPFVDDLADALREVDPLVPRWGLDVYVSDVLVEQPNEDGWHRVTAYVRRRDDAR